MQKTSISTNHLYALLAKSVPENNKIGNKKEGRYKNKQTIYKLVITLALFSAAFAASLSNYRSSTPYHPFPVYKKKSFSFGHLVMNMIMTTLKTISKRLRLKMKKPKLLDPSKLLFLMTEFIQPPDK